MKSVLIIADEFGPLLQEVLEKEGYVVSIVKSYGRLEEVYTELAKKQYDLVIPTNNSLKPERILEVVTEIKKKYPHIRIIAMSGWYDEAFVSQLKSVGVDSFVPGLHHIEEVVSKIKELLSV